MTVFPDRQDSADLVSIAADIISAYVSNNPVPIAELPKLIGDIHAALQEIGAPAAHPVVRLEPAVPIKKSVTPDYIICLEDGKRFKSLKRHLGTRYNLSPEEYRQKWSLPADYPMVAPNYAAARSALAKATGLGRNAAAPEAAQVHNAKRRSGAAAVTAAVAKSPVKKVRKTRVEI